MRLLRRRTKPEVAPPVALPSLDRLAGLIERVVELVDEVAGASPANSKRPAPAAPGSPAPPAPPQVLEPVAPPAVQTQPAVVPKPAAEEGWLAFVPSPDGYALVPRAGSLPARGDLVELDGAAFRVLRYAPSPLPGDRRRCAVIAREEPPEPERTSDA
jgi:hypothetical protein